MKVPCVLVADDHSVVLAGIRTLIGSCCEVIAEVGDGQDLVEKALRLRPDLVILDISMPVLNGIDAARQIKKFWPQAKLLFLSMHANPVYVREALGAGGAGYVLKSTASEELKPAIEAVLKGETYIAAALDRDSVHDLMRSSGRRRSPAFSLTDRQRQILQLIAEGRSNKEIAGLLRVSVKTVEFHRGRIMNRLSVHTAAELSAFAVRMGLVGD